MRHLHSPSCPHGTHPPHTPPTQPTLLHPHHPPALGSPGKAPCVTFQASRCSEAPHPCGRAVTIRQTSISRRLCIPRIMAQPLEPHFNPCLAPNLLHLPSSPRVLSLRGQPRMLIRQVLCKNGSHAALIGPSQLRNGKAMALQRRSMGRMTEAMELGA